MRLSHQPRRRSLVTTERGRRDKGYILVQFALLLVPLLLMVGFSVDVGYWYNRASDIQKAADAAALAGVVWLPDVPEARTRAREAAARNGFAHDPTGTGITVTVDPVAGTTRQLRVTIRDPKVGSFFFENLGGTKLDLSRKATAEYLLPVPLGSPENSFGNDMDKPAAQRSGLWGNIHGPPTDNYKGDAYAAGCRGSENCSTFNNPKYRTTGYLYTIDVPAGVSNMSVKVYDAGLYHRGNQNLETGDDNYGGTTNTTTTWTFYNADPTELDINDNPVATNAQCSGQSPAWSVGGKAIWTIAEEQNPNGFKNKYANLCTMAGTVPPGRYLLRVQTSGGSGANRYAIKASATSSAQPRISAYGDFSMYNNIDDGANANFFLAEVIPEHRGKTLVLDMYDPGEVSGNALMKVLSPSGSTASSCVAYSDSSTSTFASGSTLTPCQFYASQGGAKYNGSWVQLQIKIPNSYTCTPGLTTTAGCWWKIRYEIGGTATDTTTWAAQIVGDPVHLVEEEAP